VPNAKVLEQKKALVAELAEKMKKAAAGVLVDYKGINVVDDTKLRADMRKADVDYTVYKNTMIRLAAREAGLEGLDPFLSGTTALAMSETDVTAPAKVVVDYAKKIQGKYEVKAGFIEGRVVSAKEIEAIAALPPKEVLIAQVLGGLNAPITGFVNVLNANLRGLVVALNAIREKRESGAA